jgi:HSP20 family protein
MTRTRWYIGCLIPPRNETGKPQQQETEMLYNVTTASPIFGLRREIDRLFDDTFARDGYNWSPAVDIKETNTDLLVDLELPGLKPEDVEITADNGMLTIRGEKRGERKEGEENRYHLVERTYGSFMRSFTLPHGVDEDQIQAEFDNGILSIRIPKAASSTKEDPDRWQRTETAGSCRYRRRFGVESDDATKRQNFGQTIVDKLASRARERAAREGSTLIHA